jgi:hypothetical protein
LDTDPLYRGLIFKASKRPKHRGRIREIVFFQTQQGDSSSTDAKCPLQGAVYGDLDAFNRRALLQQDHACSCAYPIEELGRVSPDIMQPVFLSA